MNPVAFQAHILLFVSLLTLVVFAPGASTEKVTSCNEHLYQRRGDFYQVQDSNTATPSEGGQLLLIEEAMFPATKNFEHGVTLCSQLTIDRWYKLVEQVRHWNGPVSAALFVSAEEMEIVKEMYEKEETLRRFAVLSFVLKNKTMNVPYPVNLLRNIAVRNAPTDYIITVDADFLPRPNCHQLIESQLNAIIQADREVPTAFVIAAFEINRRAYVHHRTFPLDTDHLIKLERRRILRQFHLREFSSGHSPTNYSLWRQSKFNEWYEVQPTASYEPYVILNRLTMPKYDERFAKRYYNKIAQIFELQVFGYRFLVLPETFLVHINHAKASSPHTRKQAIEIYNQFKEEMLEIESIEERRFKSFGECSSKLQSLTPYY